MFINDYVKMFKCCVEPQTSGTRTFRGNSELDIKSLRKMLDNDKFVVVCNNVSKWSENVIEQRYVFTDKLVAEDGFDVTYVMSHYGRGANATNRKIVLSFGKDGKVDICKATYYTT